MVCVSVGRFKRTTDQKRRGYLSSRYSQAIFIASGTYLGMKIGKALGSLTKAYSNSSSSSSI